MAFGRRGTVSSKRQFKTLVFGIQVLGGGSLPIGDGWQQSLKRAVTAAKAMPS